jgi:hypothetical protein
VSQWGRLVHHASSACNLPRRGRIRAAPPSGSVRALATIQRDRFDLQEVYEMTHGKAFVAVGLALMVMAWCGSADARGRAPGKESSKGDVERSLGDPDETSDRPARTLDREPDRGRRDGTPRKERVGSLERLMRSGERLADDAKEKWGDVRDDLDSLARRLNPRGRGERP